MEQIALPINVAVAREVDGIEMGVMDDGTPYLTQRSLARLCGAAPSTITNQSAQWRAGKRDNRLARMLVDQGINRELLYIPLSIPGQPPVHAYPDDVCMIFLEYFAFEGQVPNKVALDNYRKLARASLRLFIYRATGYDPQRRIPDPWTKFHHRHMLNTTPPGFFSVFREMSELVLMAIQNGLVVDEHTVPDVSIGQFWAKHWRDTDMEKRFGPARDYPHTYPEYFPQAQANAFITAKVYPLAALGEFRIWIQSTYLPEKFPRYLENKVKRKALELSTAELILAAFDTSDVERLPALPAARSV